MDVSMKGVQIGGVSFNWTQAASFKLPARSQQKIGILASCAGCTFRPAKPCARRSPCGAASQGNVITSGPAAAGLASQGAILSIVSRSR